MVTNRPEITANLAARLEKHIDPRNDPRIYWAKEVTFDYSTDHPVRVDYMQYKPRNNSVSGIEAGDFRCFEIKSSIEDFKSKHGHNLIGDYNYYIMPQNVFETVKMLIPYAVGVYVPSGLNGLELIRKARRKDRDRPIGEMLLMMWRSSRRDLAQARRVTMVTEDGDRG